VASSRAWESDAPSIMTTPPPENESHHISASTSQTGLGVREMVNLAHQMSNCREKWSTGILERESAGALVFRERLDPLNLGSQGEGRRDDQRFIRVSLPMGTAGPRAEAVGPRRPLEVPRSPAGFLRARRTAMVRLLSGAMADYPVGLFD
jgi:hypothetical protein